jgi:hypothetical protein
MDGDADYDAKVQNTKFQTEAALGPKFENLFQKMLPHVNYFVFFGNLVNTLHAGPAATQVKIQIQGFLQMRKATALTALIKMLSSPVSELEWARCEGCLCGDEEYKACRAENSPFISIQTTGDLGINKRQGSKQDPANSCDLCFRCVVVCFPFELTPRAAGRSRAQQEGCFGGGLRLLW